jgi:hypothetical protein
MRARVGAELFDRRLRAPEIAAHYASTSTKSERRSHFYVRTLERWVITADDLRRVTGHLDGAHVAVTLHAAPTYELADESNEMVHFSMATASLLGDGGLRLARLVNGVGVGTLAARGDAATDSTHCVQRRPSRLRY